MYYNSNQLSPTSFSSIPRTVQKPISDRSSLRTRITRHTKRKHTWWQVKLAVGESYIICWVFICRLFYFFIFPPPAPFCYFVLLTTLNNVFSSFPISDVLWPNSSAHHFFLPFFDGASRETVFTSTCSVVFALVSLFSHSIVLSFQFMDCLHTIQKLLFLSVPHIWNNRLGNLGLTERLNANVLEVVYLYFHFFHFLSHNALFNKVKLLICTKVYALLYVQCMFPICCAPCFL